MCQFFNPLLVIKGSISLVFALCFSHQLISQNKVNDNIEKYYKENVASRMDTSYVNYGVETWSIRAFPIFKDHSFQLKNSNAKLIYTPNNRYGLGFGVAYYPFLLDIGFNIKGNKEEITKRFDLQAKVLLRGHYIGLIVQDYKGFNVKSQELDNEIFRSDIRSSTINLTYLYVFNSKHISIGSMFSGLHQQKKNAGSFLLGGFFSFYRMEADSSIVPTELDYLFNELSGINGTNNIGGGIIGGYGQIFVFKHDLFLSINFLPGIGLIRKDVSTESGSHQPSSPWLYRLNLNFSFGYNGPKFYVIINVGDDISTTSLDFGNWGSLNTGKAKLILGYKFRKH